MNHEQLKLYLRAQLLEIERFQRQISSRTGKSLDFNAAAMIWIECFGAKFRSMWNEDPRFNHACRESHANQACLH